MSVSEKNFNETENINKEFSLDGMYPLTTDTYDSLYKETSSSTDDLISEDEMYYTTSVNIKKLWNKKDYFYKLTKLSREKIIEDFEKKIKNKESASDDAFYSSLKIVSTSSINLLKEDSYIKTRLECRRIRDLNFEFLEMCTQNYKEIEKLIQKYRSTVNKDERCILKGIIKQKKRIDVLINKVRNSMSELVLKCEENNVFMDSVWSAVFRKSLELATTEMSSQDCN